MKQYHNLVQGSPEWIEHRADYFNASDAPAMLGESDYKSRDALVKQVALGVEEEISPALQQRFDDGHRNEALARPLAEEIIGEELFTPTVSDEVDGLKLSCSLDGETMSEKIISEHKTLNKKLAVDIPNGNIALQYQIQMEQQLLISGAEKCLFMASKDGNKETMVHIWYESNPELRERIISGWHQFKKDVEAFELPEEEIQAVAQKQESLPTVFVQVKGEIAINDNLEEFGVSLTKYVEQINHEPETDQDFANLDDAVKVLKKAEEALTAAENNALAQTASISDMRRIVADYHKLARDNRLAAEKTVKIQKVAIKNKIINEAKDNFKQHLDALFSELQGHTFIVNGDFVEAAKNKRTLASLRNAVNTELANCKITANNIAGVIRVNLTTYDELASEYKFLFSDIPNLIQKANDDFKLVVESRINKHKVDEAERIEKEREQMRLEEERKAKEKAEAEQERLRIEQENIKIAETREAQAKIDAEKIQSPTTKAEEPVESVTAVSEKPTDTGNEPKKSARTFRKPIPTGNQMIAVLANHYDTNAEMVIGWLQNIDLQELKKAS